MSKYIVDYEASLKRAKKIREYLLKKFPHLDNIVIDKHMTLHVVSGFIFNGKKEKTK